MGLDATMLSFTHGLSDGYRTLSTYNALCPPLEFIPTVELLRLPFVLRPSGLLGPLGLRSCRGLQHGLRFLGPPGPLVWLRFLRPKALPTTQFVRVMASTLPDMYACKVLEFHLMAL